MKHTILSLLLAALLLGCYPQAYIGMHQSEFKVTGAVRLYSSSATETIYYTIDMNGQPIYYYYFDNGILNKIDRGVPAPNVIVETRNR